MPNSGAKRLRARGQIAGRIDNELASHLETEIK
jgi:hypothetical protein